jgi:hypothetical protein
MKETILYDEACIRCVVSLDSLFRSSSPSFGEGPVDRLFGTEAKERARNNSPQYIHKLFRSRMMLRFMHSIVVLCPCNLVLYYVYKTGGQH